MIIYHIKVRTMNCIYYGFIRKDQLDNYLQGKSFYILDHRKPSARTFIKEQAVISCKYFPVRLKKYLHCWDNEKFD